MGYARTSKLLEVGEVYQTKPSYCDAGTEYYVDEVWTDDFLGWPCALVTDCITGEQSIMHGTYTIGSQWFGCRFHDESSNTTKITLKGMF